MALLLFSAAVSGPTRARICFIAALAAIWTKPSGSAGRELDRFERFLAPNLFENVADAPANAGIRIRQTVDQGRFGDRAHFLECIGDLETIFLDA